MMVQLGLRCVHEDALTNACRTQIEVNFPPRGATIQGDVTAIRRGGSTVKLDAIDGGLALEGRISNINGDLEFDCTEVGCFFAGGDSSGDFSLSSVLIKADVILGVTVDNRLSATLRNVSTTASNLGINSDNGWTNFLISLIEGNITSAVVGQIEALLSNTVTDELGPLLEQGLSQLAFEFSLEVPRLGEGEPITVDLITDFESTSFQQSAPRGGVLIERGGAYSAEVVTPYENLGVPNRDRCGAGGQVMNLPRSAALEIGLSDDLLNQVFYAAWRAGWLEVEGGPRAARRGRPQRPRGRQPRARGSGFKKIASSNPRSCCGGSSRPLWSTRSRALSITVASARYRSRRST